MEEIRYRSSCFVIASSDRGLPIRTGEFGNSENAQQILLTICTGRLAQEGRYAYAYALNRNLRIQIVAKSNYLLIAFVMPVKGTKDAEQVSAMREFNRFYTARLGLLHKRHLDGEFSLTEARILYEIGSSPKLTASSLRNTLELDAGYISRLLGLLTKRKLVRQTASRADGREKMLTLSTTGEKKIAALNEQSALQIQRLLETLSAADRDTVIASLSKVRSILSQDHGPAVRVVRLAEANDDALRLLQEYYEAVNVVQRDSPEAIQKIIDDASSGMWLAYLKDEAVGCVVLRKLASIPFAGECKRLYVQPRARGHRLADVLLDAQEGYARSQGLQWIYLDSYDDLKVAIALYRKRGYVPCERYNDNPQATVFLRKQIGQHSRLRSRERKIKR